MAMVLIVAIITTSPQLIRMVYASEGSGVAMEWSSVVEVLKILIPALGAWLAAYLTNRKDERKESRQWQEAQTDKLTSGWSEMTAQSREMITSLQSENADIRTRAGVAEERVRQLERENEELKDELRELRVIKEAKEAKQPRGK